MSEVWCITRFYFVSLVHVVVSVQSHVVVVLVRVELNLVRVVLVLVHGEIFSEVVDEPVTGREAPEDMALPGSNSPLSNSLLTHLLVLLHGSFERASVVEEAYIHGDLHLLH